MSYCDFVAYQIDTVNPELAVLHRCYHDQHYGVPIQSDDELFGRLILEINQAGLSWGLILQKQENFRRAFSDFSIEKISHFGEADRQRLLNDTGIIRNRLKIDAVIANAKTVRQLQQEYGSFKSWLDRHDGLNLNEWVKLFKQHFKFTGTEIVNEFLMSTAYLPGAHDPNCPAYQGNK